MFCYGKFIYFLPKVVKMWLLFCMSYITLKVLMKKTNNWFVFYKQIKLLLVYHLYSELFIYAYGIH